MTDRISLENIRVTDQGVEMKVSKAGKEYAQFTGMWSSSRKDQSGGWENGPTKFVRVIVSGFTAADVAASVSGGDRVNVSGRVEHFEWQSNNGPKDDWTLLAESVTLPVPRASQSGGGFGGQQSGQGGFGQQQNDPWNSSPQSGGFAGGDDTPPF